MEHQNKEKLIKVIKKEPILSPAPTSIMVNYPEERIHQLIPHRAPFSLLDKLSIIDLSQETIEAETEILSDDPVFRGHFPGNPIYPGVLQIEMMGQAGLCLAAFIRSGTTEIDQTKPMSGLFTRVHNAGFLSAVYPGDKLRVLAKMVEHDDFLGVICGQIMKGNSIISHSILEVYFSE